MNKPGIKLVALLSGGDWNDAGVDHLIIPEGMNLETENQLHTEWRYSKYHTGIDKEYKTFAEWLLERGANLATEEDITIYWEN